MILSFNEVKYIHVKYGETKEEIERNLLEPYNQFEERMIMWLESGMEVEKENPKQCFGKEYDPDDPECQVKCPIRYQCDDATKIFRIKNSYKKEVIKEIGTKMVDIDKAKIDEIEKIGREDILIELGNLVPMKIVRKGFKLDTNPILNVSKWENEEITIYSTKGILPYAKRWKDLKVKEYKGVKVKIDGMKPVDLLKFVKDMLYDPIIDVRKKPTSKKKKKKKKSE